MALQVLEMGEWAQLKAPVAFPSWEDKETDCILESSGATSPSKVLALAQGDPW